MTICHDDRDESMTRAMRMIRRYRAVREATCRLAAPLTPEDTQLQAMADVSPPKWHLAHTTWFFEAFVLLPLDRPYRAFDPNYGALFNSYYEGLGSVFPRPRRGLLSRPELATVMAYREAVDEAMVRWLRTMPPEADLGRVEIGLNHEMQHQELLLTDVKYNFYANPLRPAYRARVNARTDSGEHPKPLAFVEHAGGLISLGADERAGGFAFDNEMPRHRVMIEPFVLGTRLITNTEYLEFMTDRGYERPELWLADGWTLMQHDAWQAPLYWEKDYELGTWRAMTLEGMQPLAGSEPVTHLSYYEADAYARWANARLPTEAEWEIMASRQPEAAHSSANFLDSGTLAPQAARQSGLSQMFGDAWEWTASPYVPYPGYRSPVGPLGEYNGKFMCNQMVLRGGSCLSAGAHVRATYRNFFPPASRWQCSGVRLARDL